MNVSQWQIDDKVSARLDGVGDPITGHVNAIDERTLRVRLILEDGSGRWVYFEWCFK